MWEDIRFGWLCWRNQRLRWAFLVLAWGNFSAIAVIVTQLTISLSADRPRWSTSNETLYTAAYTMQGQLITTKGVDLDYAPTTPGIKAYSKYAFKAQEVLLNGVKHKVNILFYEPNFFELLQVNDKYRFVRNGGVFASTALEQQLQGSQQTVTLGKASLPIIAFLPEAFATFANKGVDLYIPMAEYSHLIPFRGANATETQAILNSLPFYYGLVSTNDDFSKTAALDFWQQQITQSTDTRVTINLASNMALISGVELYPLQRTELLRQLVTLAILCAAFGFVLLSNYFSIMAASAITRSQELSLKFALGASHRTQMLHLFRENLPMLSSVLLVGLGAVFLIQEQLYRSSTYSTYFGTALGFSWPLWLLVISICLGIIIILSLLPALNLLRAVHFSRGKGGLTKTQRRVKDVQFALQILFTLCALHFALAGGYQEWQKQRTDSLAMQTQGAKINRTDDKTFSLPAKWLLGQDPNIAFSSEALIGSRLAQYKLTLQGDSHDQAHFVDRMYVTPNFFEVIEAKWHSHNTLSAGSVIINRALAENLADGANINNLLNMQVELEDQPSKPLTIVGIVENLPHAGVNLSNIPMLYQPLSEQDALYSSLYLYTTGNIAKMPILPQLDLTPEWANMVLLGDIEQQLIDLNKNRRALLFITLHIALLILVMLTIGLLYQLQGMLFAEQRTIGLYLAIGQQQRSLMRGKLLKQLAWLALTSMAFIAIIWLLADIVWHSMELNINASLPIALSMALVAISVTGTTVLVLRKLTHFTIQGLLTGQGQTS